MMTPDEAMQRLLEGNRRYVAGKSNFQSLLHGNAKKEFPEGKSPVAIILGCSDSPVPAEIIFDQGPGDLFVIRVAGNVVAPTQIGSVEIAARQLGISLVVVLGHSGCDAVKATLEEINRPTADNTASIYSIIRRIRPGVEALFQTRLRDNPHLLLSSAIRSNIHASAENLRNGSRLIAQCVEEGSLDIVPAEFSQETGVVEFLADDSSNARVVNQ